MAGETIEALDRVVTMGDAKGPHLATVIEVRYPNGGAVYDLVFDHEPGKVSRGWLRFVLRKIPRSPLAPDAPDAE